MVRTVVRSASVVAAVLVALGLASCTQNSGDPFNLKVGMCLPQGAQEGVIAAGDSRTVPCSEPHVGEVYDSITLKDGKYPGDEALVRESAKCETTFQGFVGKAYAESDLKLAYFHPTKESWERGDREILCVVEVPSGTVTNTLKGSAR